MRDGFGDKYKIECGGRETVQEEVTEIWLGS